MLLNGSELKTDNKERFAGRLAQKYEPSEAQVIAWHETFRIFSGIVAANPLLEKAEFKFEYEIPFTGGTRPDVLMFVRDAIYIIEFKNRFWSRDDDLDQLAGYHDLITNYHSEGFRYRIKPVLLLNSGGERDGLESGINVVSSSKFIKVWSKATGADLAPFRPAREFLAGRYNPARDIVRYARDTFNNAKIRGIGSPLFRQTEEAYSEIARLIDDARTSSTHTLVMVSGEPGSGKSSLALRLTHEFSGCYITRNPHFLKLVTSQLGHHCNIYNSNSILKEAVENNRYPEPNVVVIDEAQRVTDGWKVRKNFRVDRDEIEILLSHITDKQWSCTVAFIGLDQDLSSSDIDEYTRWPAVFVKILPGIRKKVISSSEVRDKSGRRPGKPVKSLHLSCNIRAGLDDSFSRAVNLIVDDPLNSDIRHGIRGALEAGYRLFVTRDLEQAKAYVSNRYGDRGLSSCITGTLFYEGVKVLEWDASRKFNVLELMKRCDLDEMDREETGLCQYHVLGLEFNMPVLVWKADLLYYDGGWKYDLLDYTENHGRLGYIHNAYRVLMTRGRDGLIIYLPDIWKFNSTYDYFKRIGFRELHSGSV